MDRKKILLIVLAFLAITGTSLVVLPAHSNVPPPWTLSLSANSRTTSDSQIFPTCTTGKTFFIGAIINASGGVSPATAVCGAQCLQNVFGWQFSIVYDNTSFVPQGDPLAGSATDPSGPTVNFGAQTTAGN